MYEESDSMFLLDQIRMLVQEKNKNKITIDKQKPGKKLTREELNQK